MNRNSRIATILAFILTLVMALSFTACGSGTNDSEATQDTTAPVEAEDEVLETLFFTWIIRKKPAGHPRARH